MQLLEERAVGVVEDHAQADHAGAEAVARASCGSWSHRSRGDADRLIDVADAMSTIHKIIIGRQERCTSTQAQSIQPP